MTRDKTMINRLIYIILIIFVIFSCTPTPEIKFLEPQPKDKRDLQNFPKNFQGGYLSKSDSSILIIDDNMIYQKWDGYSKFDTIGMKENFDTIFENNATIAFSDNFKYFFEVDGDSTTVRLFGIDTIFKISESTKLRSLKGYLFLNFVSIDSTWRVKTIKLIDGELSFDNLVSYNQIDTLKDITQINSEIDTLSNRIDYFELKPNKKELKKILKFKNTDTKFIKL